MKKITKVALGSIFIIIMSLVSVNHSEAASGACSWHGGVNCSSWPQSNGNVRCNDGWTDSSVYYEFMDSCRDYLHDFCYKDLMNNINLRDSYVKDINKAIDNIKRETLMAADTLTRRQNTNYLNLLYAMRDRHIKMYENIAETGTSQCINNIFNSVRDMATSYSKPDVTDYPVTIDKKSAIICNPNSSLKSDVCSCNPGYIDQLGNNTCISVSQACIDTYGQNAIGKNNNTTNTADCYCKENYHWNKEKTKCELDVSYATSSKSLNIRTSSSINSKIISSFKLNKKYEIIGYEKDWVKIRFDSGVGFVLKSLIKIQKN